MTKFKRVLSDAEVHDLFALDNDVFRADSDGNFYTQDGHYFVDTIDLFEISRKLEQAVLAKLVEQQEPTAWVILDSEGVPQDVEPFYHGDTLSIASKFKRPLYAHPCVSPTSDKSACVSGSEKSDTQHHLEYIKRYQKWRRGEDKTMTEAGLEPKQIGEALDWLIEVVEDHIADAGKMITPLTQRKIQSVIDSGECREMKGATVQVSENGRIIKKTLDEHRAEFEVWAGSKADKNRSGKYYRDINTQYDWSIWKAAKGIAE